MVLSGCEPLPKGRCAAWAISETRPGRTRSAGPPRPCSGPSALALPLCRSLAAPAAIRLPGPRWWPTTRPVGLSPSSTIAPPVRRLGYCEATASEFNRNLKACWPRLRILALSYRDAKIGMWNVCKCRTSRRRAGDRHCRLWHRSRSDLRHGLRHVGWYVGHFHCLTF